jgi:hypothetical protein
MKLKVVFLFLLAATLISCKNISDVEYVTLSGIVTDFYKSPVNSAVVKIKNKDFDDIYETFTDKYGRYSLKVKKGIYYSIYVIKEDDYGKSKLEYWAWNVPLLKDLVLNAGYDRLEVYGINVFEPKVKPYDTYRIYFRPKSLKKFLEIDEINKGDTIDIAPALTKKDITVKINGVVVGIKTIDRVLEFSSRGNYIFAYEIQVMKPEKSILTLAEKVDGFDKISVFVHSPETGEKGEADYFYKQKN